MKCDFYIGEKKMVTMGLVSNEIHKQPQTNKKQRINDKIHYYHTILYNHIWKKISLIHHFLSLLCHK